MNNIFLALFLLAIVAFFVGLINPSTLKLKTRKSAVLRTGGAMLAFFILIGITTPSTPKEQVPEVAKIAPTTQASANTPITNEQVKSAPVEKPKVVQQVAPVTPKATQDTSVKATQPTITAPITAPVQQQSDRANVLVKLKADASAKWGNDYQMVQYQYNNQTEAYDWVMSQTKYPDIMAKAKSKWGYDYQMVKYQYNNQVEAYEWVMAQTEYPSIMASAKQKWGTDYQMVKYEYNNQVEAYKGL